MSEQADQRMCPLLAAGSLGVPGPRLPRDLEAKVGIDGDIVCQREKCLWWSHRDCVMNRILPHLAMAIEGISELKKAVEKLKRS